MNSELVVSGEYSSSRCGVGRYLNSHLVGTALLSSTWLQTKTIQLWLECISAKELC